jgi:hypothetical protein
MTIKKSYSCDSCFIKMNQKYVLKTDSLFVSITFINDSTYTLRSEKAQDRWVSYGKWRKLSDNFISIIPIKGGLKLKVEHNGRIFKVDGSYHFELKEETIRILCVDGEENIRIDNYTFKRKQK